MTHMGTPKSWSDKKSTLSWLLPKLIQERDLIILGWCLSRWVSGSSSPDHLTCRGESLPSGLWGLIPVFQYFLLSVREILPVLLGFFPPYGKPTKEAVGMDLFCLEGASSGNWLIPLCEVRMDCYELLTLVTSRGSVPPVSKGTSSLLHSNTD